MIRALTTGCLAAASLALLACAGDPEDAEPQALDEALAGTRTGDAPRTSADSLPHTGADPHRIRMSAEFTVDLDDGTRVHLELDRTVDRGEGGAFRVNDERTWTHPDEAPDGVTDGREAVFDGEAFAIRRFWAPWMRRETFGGYEERLLRAAYDIMPMVRSAFGEYIRWAPAADGEERLAGLPVAWSTASLDPRVAPRQMDPERLAELRDHEVHWPAWMAATHVPSRIEGRVARRADGPDEVVAGELRVDGTVDVAGAPRPFRLVATYEVEPLPSGARFAVPEDALSARRARPWRMIRDVLGEELRGVYRP